MTPAQTALAKRLVACKQWRWVEGMLTDLGRVDNVELDGRAWTADSEETTGYVPDLADFATAAIVMRMALEASPRALDPITGVGVGYASLCIGIPGSQLAGQWVMYEDRQADPDLGTVAARALLAAWGEPS